MKRKSNILIVFLATLAVSNAAIAQSKNELKERFRAREAELREQKRDGVIGETVEGYIAIVKEESAAREVRDLVDAENNDREKLYQILADEINKETPDAKVKATAATVAQRNAKRNIERADGDEWLRIAKDHWIRVKEFPRFEKLFKLKTQGKVGETDQGTIEVVKDEDRNDQSIARLVKEENDAREKEYEALAKEEKVARSAIIERMVKRNFDNARIGDMLKEGDRWRKK